MHIIPSVLLSLLVFTDLGQLAKGARKVVKNTCPALSGLPLPSKILPRSSSAIAESCCPDQTIYDGKNCVPLICPASQAWDGLNCVPDADPPCAPRPVYNPATRQCEATPVYDCPMGRY
ncbi:hypothetical protein BO70DRAFT_395037 [Aspergillus heteromorphus CBS 117.55]|uniref:Uncharacterized protein n=1 Tax=Aspergillus heteromorphus CBS 117.55 TaxID=1448321 RepID=A0A317WHY5_9EURO|nr:uncharacterized protein BO70DRAFT_395037 [Aspergillus heteromorphus CBS 117.55]PWY85899.1 hypothetical protein BO70DRAFT_395037 [Aspergillus heteromorphus CBS 117.55]